MDKKREEINMASGIYIEATISYSMRYEVPHHTASSNHADKIKTKEVSKW